MVIESQKYILTLMEYNNEPIASYILNYIPMGLVKREE